VTVDISIVTPSCNMFGYLTRCCASVADQEGASCEHIVVDAVSTDGSVEWLKRNPGVTSVIEQDEGMYDAVNKGFGLARGDVVGYLNCDEQYLPGALAFVKAYFRRHSRCDLLFGNALLIRPDGTLISYRKGYQPRWYYILSSHLYVLSCTMFLRRRIIDDGFRFDKRLKDIGDQDFVVRLLRHGYRAKHAGRYLAAFTMTGANMSAGANARLERRQALAAAPRWVRALKVPLNAGRLAEKLFSGAYWQRMPLEYAVHTTGEGSGRVRFRASKASFRWKAA